MPGLSPAAFQRPRFTALPPKDAPEEDISSIPDLIRFNGLHNPDRIFCIQSEIPKDTESSESSNKYSGVSITYKQLDDAVCRCAEWLRNSPATRDGVQKSESPVALYLESDVGLFIHMMALQKLNIPVRPLLSLLSVNANRAPGSSHIRKTQRTKCPALARKNRLRRATRL